MSNNVLLSCTAWFLCCQLCLAGDTLNAGEKIIDPGRTLISAQEKFELGFFSPVGSTGAEKYLGIWYFKLEPRTVVWVANRDNPIVDPNAIFQIAEDGNLVVSDKSGKRYWYSGLKRSSPTSKTVKLMDSGNLVLVNDHSGVNYLWQSFQHPTDTFLPCMKMNTNLELTSWRGASDPGSGSFTFKLPQTGDRRYIIVKNQSQLYWESEGLSSEAMHPNVLYLLANSTSSTSSHELLHKNITWEQDNFSYEGTRILMNSSGEIQFWKLESSQWTLRWREPASNCKIYNYCRNFSSCNSNYLRHCKCLPGFSPGSPENQESGRGPLGCVRKSRSCTNQDMIFLNLKMIKVGNPDQKFPTETEAECQSICLHNCSRCQAYSYNASSYSDRSSFSCGIWTRDLPTLQEEYQDGRDLSILVKSSDIASTGKSCSPCGTYIIPYPLSTGPNCGDPMYKLNCDPSKGQVNFTMPGGRGTYRVTWIDGDARKFFIKMSDDQCETNSNYQNDKSDFPFNATNWCVEDDTEISWLPPPEPPCSKSTDCKDWPHSRCNTTSERKGRCLCNSGYEWNRLNLSCSKERKHSTNRLLLILTVTLASMIFLVCIISFVYVWWRKKIAQKQDGESVRIHESLYDSERHVKGLIGLGGLEEKDSEGIEVPCYTFGSILAATDNFSDSKKLGRGGYGPVYKGRFPGGQDIAVKRLSSVSTQGLQEFKNEVVLIAKLQHRNLVRLRGYCIKGDEKILLYEYMPNKSLDSFIFDRTRTVLLDWQMRFDIILGIARGLLYLHQDSRLRVIHRDLKTSNILLDEEMNPKISDFGLARIFGGKETEASTERVVGTYGYMSPEYALDGFFSIKSDVFSFGVVLLEILSGKKTTGFYQSKQSSSLLGHAWRLWTANKLLDLMDPCLAETCNENQFIRCAHIGLLCVQDEPGDRPTMSNVVIMLDSETATVPTPTEPTFFVRSLSGTASSSSKPETSLQFEIESSYQEGR